MEDAWKVLKALHIKPSAENATRNADKKYAEDLAVKHQDEKWRAFYLAIQALESGCGYLHSDQLSLLVEECAECNHIQLLHIIEEKEEMLGTVILLHYVDHGTKLKWLTSNDISTVPVLFECIRQELDNDVGAAEVRNALICGMCKLEESSPERFQYLLSRYLLYRPNIVSLMEGLLPRLSDKGWTALSDSISFLDTEYKHMLFWDQCGKNLDWSQIYSSAYPLIGAWDAYINQSIANGKFGESLYNSISNYLINILYHQMESFETYVDMFEKAVSDCEEAMQHWYERSVQQRDSLLACLAQIELLRIVWVYRQETYSVSFPDNLCKRVLQFLSQFRFLWDNPLAEKSKREILQLKEWLEQPETNATIFKQQP